MKHLKLITLFTAITLSASVSAELFYSAIAQTELTSELTAIDSETCVMNTIGFIGYPVTALALDPNGMLYGADPQGGQLISINTLNGAGSVIGPLVDGGANSHPNIPDMAFNGFDLFGWTELSDDLVRINQVTSTVTVISSDRSSFGTGLAIDSSGTIYLSPNGFELFTVDSTSGVATVGPELTDIATLGNTSAMTFDANDVLWANVIMSNFSGGPGNLVRIDHITGDYEVICSNLPLFTDSLVYYGESTDLIYRHGFE